jgi:hypothetical protein
VPEIVNVEANVAIVFMLAGIAFFCLYYLDCELGNFSLV